MDQALHFVAGLPRWIHENTRRLSALGKMHRYNDLPWNAAHGAIQGPLRALLRKHGRRHPIRAQLAGRSIFGQQTEHTENIPLASSSPECPARRSIIRCANLRMRNTNPPSAKTNHYGAGKSVAKV
jgi:hypothetical protein